MRQWCLQFCFEVIVLLYSVVAFFFNIYFGICWNMTSFAFVQCILYIWYLGRQEPFIRVRAHRHTHVRWNTLSSLRNVLVMCPCKLIKCVTLYYVSWRSTETESGKTKICSQGLGNNNLESRSSIHNSLVPSFLPVLEETSNSLFATANSCSTELCLFISKSWNILSFKVSLKLNEQKSHMEPYLVSRKTVLFVE